MRSLVFASGFPIEVQDSGERHSLPWFLCLFEDVTEFCGGETEAKKFSRSSELSSKTTQQAITQKLMLLFLSFA